MNKIIRDNMFNRLFHCHQVKEQHETLRKHKALVCATPSFLQALEECSTLQEVLNIHKDLWGSGFQNIHIGPCSTGFFRTKDILSMTPDEVFLGNIYGLWTYNIPDWEKRRDKRIGVNGFGVDEDYSLYKIILDQYRNRLIFNVRGICEQAKEYIADYEAVNH